MPIKSFSIAIVGSGLVISFLLGAASRAAAQLPDLSGKWRINAELSDDANKKLENALPSSRAVGPIVSQSGSNNDARGRDREQTRRRIEALIEASETLEIKQGKDEITVAEGNLRERKFYTDGRPSHLQDRRGNLSTVRARWRAAQLVVDTKLADGGRFTESYELAPGRRQLIVTMTSQDPRLRQALVIRRVYDEVSTAED